MSLTLTVDGASLGELVAAEVARAFAAREAAVSPWLRGHEKAAAYLDCPLSRVKKLSSMGKLPTHYDGRAVLYRRDELDAFIAAGGATSC